jgi:hypothetical protein
MPIPLDEDHLSICKPAPRASLLRLHGIDENHVGKVVELSTYIRSL